MTGTINRQEGSHDGSTSTFYYNILNYFAKRDNNKGNQTAQITFTDRPGTSTFPNNVRTSDIYLMTAKNFSGGQLGQYLDTTLSIVANQDGGRIGISKLNPAYKLDVNGTLGVTGQSTFSNNVFVGNFTDNTPISGANHNIRLESNDVSSIGFHDAGNTIANIRFSAATGFIIGASDGTFGPHSTTMAGATTLTGALTVNNATVLNEGSGDFDTRIESDGNANMVFVDASTDRVGIGTGTPSSTLSVNGSVNATDLSLTNPLPITSGGTGAESASVARTTLAVGYTFIASTAGSAVLSNSNRVSLVNTGGGSTTSIDLTTASIGRMYMIKNLASGTVVSDASNVIPFAGGSAGTAILSAGNLVPQWCILVADGTNWHIMQRN
jgi:hypothetical protein